MHITSSIALTREREREGEIEKKRREGAPLPTRSRRFADETARAPVEILSATTALRVDEVTRRWPRFSSRRFDPAARRRCRRRLRRLYEERPRSSQPPLPRPLPSNSSIYHRAEPPVDFIRSRPFYASIAFSRHTVMKIYRGSLRTEEERGGRRRIIKNGLLPFSKSFRGLSTPRLLFAPPPPPSAHSQPPRPPFHPSPATFLRKLETGGGGGVGSSPGTWPGILNFFIERSKRILCHIKILRPARRESFFFGLSPTKTAVAPSPFGVAHLPIILSLTFGVPGVKRSRPTSRQRRREMMPAAYTQDAASPRYITRTAETSFSI